MPDRICVKCGKPMEVLKTGMQIVHIDSEKAYSSDLWGCRTCNSFQLHGIPKEGKGGFAIVYEGEIVTDPSLPSYNAILEPSMSMPEYFGDHMKKWYPHWNWR